jgi:hypothetical protein
MPLNIGSQFHRKTIRHIVMKSLQPDPEFSGNFRFIMAQTMTHFLQLIVQKPEQPDALISGTVTAMRTIGHPMKPVRNVTVFGVGVTQNGSAFMLRVIHANGMTLTPPWAGKETARRRAQLWRGRKPAGEPNAVGKKAATLTAEKRNGVV